MRRGFTMMLTAAGLGALLMTAAVAASSADDQAAYEKRDATMKILGRNVYGGVGRVVQGKIKYSPDTVTAAETADKTVAALPGLFPPGSDVPKSKMNPKLAADQAEVQALSTKVQQAVAALVPAVQSGDMAKMAAAYKLVDDSCDACHSKYRND